MRTVRDIKALFRNAAIGTRPAADRAVLRDALDAGGLTSQGHPAHSERIIWRFLMESRMVKLTAAAAILITAAIVGVHYFSPTPVRAVEFSEITEAMSDVPWVHTVTFAQGEPLPGRRDEWFCFKTQVLAEARPDGKMTFWRHQERTKASYDPKSNTITLSSMEEDDRPPYVSSPAEFLEAALKDFQERGGKIVARMDDYQGRRVQVQEFSGSVMTHDGVPKYVTGKIYVDPRSKLLYGGEVQVANANGAIDGTAELTVDYPQTGPQDIYDVGAPRDARVIDDELSGR